MKILITERQHRHIINEEVSGIDELMGRMVSKFPEIKEYEKFVIKFIEDSNCQKIEISNNTFSAYGLALHDKVVINPTIFNFDLGYFLYILFHEIAHQYQYKKYGAEYVYKIYLGKTPIDDAVIVLRKIENVADQFAMRKCRELKKLGLDIKLKAFGAYDNTPDINFKTLLVKLRNLLKKHKAEDPIKISETYYNYIVNRNDANINNDI